MKRERVRIEGGSIRVDGPSRALVIRGEATTNKGTEVCEGEELVIRRGERLTLTTDSELEVELVLGTGAGYSVEEDDVEIPSDWKELDEELADHGGTPICMVIGPQDSGKTTLVTFIANELVERGLKVGVVDADIGQSDVGPPAVVSLGIVEDTIHDLSEVEMRHGYFVGSITPSGHLLQTTIGTRRMVDLALAEGANAVLIDTSGMVHGGPARALKLHKVDVIRPSHVAFLDRNGQVSHIKRMVRSLEYIEVHDLTVPEAVKDVERKDRIRRREHVLREFFEKREILELDLEEISVQRAFIGTGEPVDLEEESELPALIKAVSGVEPEILHAERAPDAVILVVRDQAGRIVGRGGRHARELRRLLNVREFVVVNEEELQGVLVGLCDGAGDLLGIGVIREIDFTSGELKVEGRLLRGRTIRVVQLGSLKVDPETGSHEPMNVRV
ncbi:Clp1/GlmU family protein [Methanopyrus sp.]